MKRVIQTATAFALLLSPSFQTSAQITQTAAPQTSSPQAAVSTNTQADEVLTLEAATEQLLRRNISLEAARLEIGVAEAERIGATQIWVLPNPSGLNAHYQAADLAKLFRELREAIESEK